MYDGRWESAIAGYDLVASPKESTVDSSFIAEYLLGNVAQSYFRGKRDRSAQPHLNSDQLKRTFIPIPSLPEQQDIGRVLQLGNVKIAALEQEISLLAELFKAMLEELMTGRLSAVPLIQE